MQTSAIELHDMRPQRSDRYACGATNIGREHSPEASAAPTRGQEGRVAHRPFGKRVVECFKESLIDAVDGDELMPARCGIQQDGRRPGGAIASDEDTVLPVDDEEEDDEEVGWWYHDRDRNDDAEDAEDDASE